MNGDTETEETRADRYSTPRREAYADLLEKCVWAGMAMLAVTFALYLGGVLEPLVPIARLPSYWEMSAAEYLAATGFPGGWSWVGQIGRGDALNLVGLAFLSLVTVFCYLRVLPFFLRERDYPMAIIAALEIAVLLLAASGLLA